jgi:outer membrane lipoprotein-sorting protein
MNDNEKYIEEFVNDIPFDASNEKHRDELKNQLLNTFPKHRLQPTAHAVGVWRTIMKSRITKLAAAAVIFVAVLAGLPLLDSKQGVVLADVLVKIEQVRAFMYKMNMKMTISMGKNMPAMDMDMEMTMTISSDFGMKAETISVDVNTGQKSTSMVYIIPDEGIAVTLMPDKKKYMQMEYSDDLFAKMKQENKDPREMIKKMIGSEYIELGRSTIDGVEVDGFQTTDPTVIGVGENVTLTLWIDAESWLPVRSEIESKMGDQMQVHCVVSEFNWDVPVTADDFKPVIPDDFEPMGTGMQMPKISEEGLIEGLRLFAELSGSYPKKISMMELAQEMMGFMTNRDVIEKIKEKIPQFRDLDGDELDELDMDEVVMKSMQITQPLQSPGFFYMTLVQEKKEPVYYGESVVPDDAEAVLMRWKVSESQYRIIFGDLSTLDVSADELVKLEKLIPK